MPGPEAAAPAAGPGPGPGVTVTVTVTVPAVALLSGLSAIPPARRPGPSVGPMPRRPAYEYDSDCRYRDYRDSVVVTVLSTVLELEGGSLAV